jgi:hypothetical protein
MAHQYTMFVVMHYKGIPVVSMMNVLAIILHDKLNSIKELNNCNIRLRGNVLGFLPQWS